MFGSITEGTLDGKISFISYVDCDNCPACVAHLGQHVTLGIGAHKAELHRRTQTNLLNTENLHRYASGD